MQSIAEQELSVELGSFSRIGAEATEWAQAGEALRDAQVYWLSTVRPTGRPHVTPLVGIWLDGALYFCTGPAERKAKNLVQNTRCAVTTGCNRLDGLHIVVEGSAELVGDEDELRVVAGIYESKYGAQFTEPAGVWFGLADAIRAGQALVYRVAPRDRSGSARARSSARLAGGSLPA